MWRIQAHDIQPGKPDQNAFSERFDWTKCSMPTCMRISLKCVRPSVAWLTSYNKERAHGALGSLPSQVSRLLKNSANDCHSGLS